MKQKLSFILLFCAVCFLPAKGQQPASLKAFTGATIIDGSGLNPVSDGVLLVLNGKIVGAGSRSQLTIPQNAEIINVAGKTIIPGLINAHGHVGEVIGIEGGHYSRQTIEANLSAYARYGITTVVSLGGDKIDAEPFRATGDTSKRAISRLYIAGNVITGNTPAEATSMVDENHRMGVDIMKIRVDDNLGASQKMREEVYKDVIERSHQLGYQLAVHMYYLEDAKKLLRSGADFIAHSVRDKPVDQEFTDLIKDKKVCYCATLTRELSTFVYEGKPDFFADPFFLKEYNMQVIAPLLDPARQQQVRNSIAAQTYKKQLPVAMENLKVLSAKGIPIAFGTDSGVPQRFIGYFEHLELEMMAAAGLSPMQIIVSATRDAASCMKLKDIGLLKPGYNADFVILDKDPLADIKNSRSINSVWIGGEKVPRL